MAAKDGVEKADPAILEPVMKVEVTTPEEFMGDVIGDLNSTRGQIDGIDERGERARHPRATCRSPRCSATQPSCAA